MSSLMYFKKYYLLHHIIQWDVKGLAKDMKLNQNYKRKIESDFQYWPSLDNVGALPCLDEQCQWNGKGLLLSMHYVTETIDSIV